MKRKFGIFISIFCFFLSLVILFLTFSYGKNNALLSYDVTNDASYKVYLKQNDYYDKPFLTDQNNIPVNFIDYITVNFNNEIFYNKNINTNYTYDIKAIIEVRDLNKQTDNIIYEKEYVLLDKKKVSNNTIKNEIKKSVDVDYNTYNELVNKYKLDLKMQVDAELKVVMSINYKNDLMDKKEEITMNIPLSVNTLNITSSYDKGHHEEIIREIDNKYIFIIISLVLFCLSVGTLIYSLNYVFASKEDYKEYKLKKILSYYETMIVEVNEKLINNNYEIISINYFKDMIDLNMQMHLPIMYYKNDGLFVVKSENTLYVYKLNDKVEKI